MILAGPFATKAVLLSKVLLHSHFLEYGWKYLSYKKGHYVQVSKSPEHIQHLYINTLSQTVVCPFRPIYYLLTNPQANHKNTMHLSAVLPLLSLLTISPSFTYASNNCLDFSSQSTSGWVCKSCSDGKTTDDNIISDHVEGAGPDHRVCCALGEYPRPNDGDVFQVGVAGRLNVDDKGCPVTSKLPFPPFFPLGVRLRDGL